MPAPLRFRHRGLLAYEPTWREMQAITEQRDDRQPDEVWLLEHPPVYTLGLAGKPEHLLDAGGIPVVKVDRGGQVTYHGPGQRVAYLLLDLRRRKLGVRDAVTLMENAVIDTLDHFGIAARARPEAPGVYVGDSKIAAVGLRIRRGCSYHGLSLNVAMDLSPFQGINPCGYPGLTVTQLSDLAPGVTMAEVDEVLQRQLVSALR